MTRLPASLTLSWASNQGLGGRVGGGNVSPPPRLQLRPGRRAAPRTPPPQSSASGIFHSRPRHCHGDGVKFRQAIRVGETTLSPAEVEAAAADLGATFRGNRYHLLQRNCNHFSSEFARKLTGRRAPGWINRLAGLAVAFNCLLPRHWLPELEPPGAEGGGEAFVGLVPPGYEESEEGDAGVLHESLVKRSDDPRLLLLGRSRGRS